MIILIAAIARNGIIGSEGALPWSAPADMQRFRSLTMGHPVIMGRRTFESIGGTLAGRANIVLTRNAEFAADGVVVADSLDAALGEAGDGEVYVIGGEQIYELFLPLADRLELTIVDDKPDGDAVFPAWNESEWQVVAAATHDGDPALDFVTLERVPAAAVAR